MTEEELETVAGGITPGLLLFYMAGGMTCGIQIGRAIGEIIK